MNTKWFVSVCILIGLTFIATGVCAQVPQLPIPLPHSTAWKSESSVNTSLRTLETPLPLRFSRTKHQAESVLSRPTTGSTTQIFNVELIGQIGGSTYAVAVQGNYAYIGVGPHLVILNIANPALPYIVGQTRVLPGAVQTIFASWLDCKLR
jgi:hypothetical protein